MGAAGFRTAAERPSLRPLHEQVSGVDLVLSRFTRDHHGA